MGQDRLHCVPLKKYGDSPFLASVPNHHDYEKTIMTMQLVSIEEKPCIGERHASNTGLPVNTKSKFHGVGGNSEKWTLKITLV